MAVATAVDLRTAFRAIPKEKRDANQSFAIRVWRALSWLEQAELASDVDSRFVNAWIAFNALYGRTDEQNHSWGDREAWSTFLAIIWRVDHEGHLRTLLCRKQLPVLRLIENRFLYDKFWLHPQANHVSILSAKVRELLPRFGKHNMLPILDTLFDRIYVMRLQVFHGASTKGSSMNRRTVSACTEMLCEFLPTMIDIMIRNGVGTDWGRVCFPPVK